MVERILDLGVGEGGKYLLRNNSLRVGLDVNYTALDILRENYPKVLICQGNIENPLPFKDSEFDSIDIMFPCDELLWDLCRGQDLWNEMKRITREHGRINIVLELPHDRMQGLEFHGKDRLLYDPYLSCLDVIRKAGLMVISKELSKEEVRALGTTFANLKASEMESDTYPPKVYCINAYKNSFETAIS